MLAGQKIRYSEKYNEISLYGFFGWSVTEIMMIMKDFTLQSVSYTHLDVYKRQVEIKRNVRIDPAWIDSSNIDDPTYSSYLYAN